MIDRRAVMMGSVGLIGLAATGFAAPVVHTGRLRGVRDARLGRDFDARAAMHGLPVVDSKRDMAALLYGRGRDWIGQGSVLIGLTGYADFHVLSGIARERRASLLAVHFQMTGDAIVTRSGRGEALLIQVPPAMRPLFELSATGHPDTVAWVAA